MSYVSKKANNGEVGVFLKESKNAILLMHLRITCEVQELRQTILSFHKKTPQKRGFKLSLQGLRKTAVRNCNAQLVFEADTHVDLLAKLRYFSLHFSRIASNGLRQQFTVFHISLSEICQHGIDRCRILHLLQITGQITNQIDPLSR